MSRTFHETPRTCHRHQRVQNRRKSEETVLDSVKQEGIIPKHYNRLKAFWTIIPEPWDDYVPGAWREYHNKKSYPFWTKLRLIFKNRRRRTL